jgi:hypothetical protein
VIQFYYSYSFVLSLDKTAVNSICLGTCYSFYFKIEIFNYLKISKLFRFTDMLGVKAGAKVQLFYSLARKN